MSEELKQKKLTKNGIKIGDKFEWYSIGNTTISELAKYNIIPQRDYGDYNKKRPDGLLVDRTNKKDIRVIAVIEYKDGKKFKSDKEVKEAIEQCNSYAQILGAIFGVATDTNVSYRINPKQENKDYQYKDSFGINRSYSFIRDEEQQVISTNFYLQLIDEFDVEKLEDETKETKRIINRILESDISVNNSILTGSNFVNPINLAKSVRQDIYVATGKEPTKCLYNVVELFIFKFLSDLGVLERDKNFQYLINMYKDGYSNNDVLEHYAIKCRKEIRLKFKPDDEDGTTIINGTIFVDNDKPVYERSTLFKQSILKYNSFENLVNVEKEFKTKLYESFLKRDSGVKGMGQFFTPRKVIQEMVDMAKVELILRDGSKVCDPFCGVGGFPLEIMSKRNFKDFVIKGNKIEKKVEYYGFDKGSSEKDSERTIILAKANMLIYLSQLLKINPNITPTFADLFNSTFKLKKGVLGTLGDVSDEQYDLIMTNPPYVTAGSTTLKNEIKTQSKWSDFYQINATGVEGLGVEWIIKKLKKGGKAFIVLPEGVLNRNTDKKLREFIMKECSINGIISLPGNTFFTTPQKTYIVILTKKDDNSKLQTHKIFTYLVSDIGETLDINRFNTGSSHLSQCTKLFKMFDGNEEYFETKDGRCKIVTIEKLIEEINNNWTVDRWWSKEEKINLGIDEQEVIFNKEDFIEEIKRIKEKFENIESEIYTTESLEKDIISKNIPIKTFFDIYKGSAKYTKKYIYDNKGEYSVYSSQTTNNGEIGRVNTYDYDCDCITWTTDGIYAGTPFIRRGEKFSMSTHCGALILKEKYRNSVNLEYIYWYLKNNLRQYAIGTDNKRVTTTIIKDIEIKMPMLCGEYDISIQSEIANKYSKMEKIKENILQEINIFEKIKIEL